MLDEDDHRLLGQRLDLFHLQEEAPGMVFWHPRGFALFRVLEEAVRRCVAKDGYREVRTPQVLRQSIWEASGHWQSFSADMMLLEDEEHRAALKPVSCPGHLQIAARAAPSYRDLPLRYAELGIVHRNEPRGALHGLFRLRQFTQDDGHVLCDDAQIEPEVLRFLRSVRALYAAFGFDEIGIGFSTRPPVRAGDDASWDRAESVLLAASRAAGMEPVIQPGQGAFYGPKLELSLRDRLGRAWQCGTIQLDLVMPQRFDVAYVAASGARLAPAMLHRAMLGSLERFLGVLLEHHRGALPPWLAPDQLVVAPVAEAHRAYAERVFDRLSAAGMRARFDAGSDTLSRRVVEAHEQGIPLFVVVGAREAERGSITVRERDGKKSEMSLDEGITDLGRRCAPPC